MRLWSTHFLKALGLFVLLSATAGVLGTSCQRRPLIDTGYNNLVEVDIDISNISNVTCDIYNASIPVPEIEPQMMHVLFFDPESGGVVTQNFITDKGTDEQGRESLSGSIVVPPGEYKLLAYQFDTESTIVKNYESYEDAYAVSENVSESIRSRYAALAAAMKSKSSEEDGSETKDEEREEEEELIVTHEPDHMVVARSENEVIPYHTGVYTVRTEASSVVETYYLQIKVEGLKWVSSATAFLSGMASGKTLAPNSQITQPESTVYVKLVKSKDGDADVICNIFNTFGRISGSQNDLAVTFDISTTDGRSVQRTFDISDLFLTDNAVLHHWLLLEETITIDPPEDPGTEESGGFAPSVEDWEEEHHSFVI